jgi:hypothetical protein
MQRVYLRPGDQLLDDDGNRFVVVEEIERGQPRLIRLSDGSFRYVEGNVAFPVAWLSGADREGL